MRETPSTLMWPLSVSATPASSSPIPAVLGMEPTQTRQWLPVTLEPSPRVTTTPSSVRSTVSARARESTFSAAAFEDALKDLGGVGVRARQHAVAAGNQGDLGAEAVVGGGEFGAGDAGTDHDQFLGELVHVVDLRPVQDAVAVRARGGQLARVGADGQQDRVGLHRLGAVGGQDLDGVVVQHLAGADQDADVLVFQALAGCPRTAAGPGRSRRSLMCLRSARIVGRAVAAVDVELDAQLAGLADAGHQVRRRDQGLGRHDVGQHRGSAEPRALDDGDLRPQRGGDHGGFVAAGPSAENCDAG